MLRKLIWLVVAFVFIGAVVFWLITIPQTVSASALGPHTPDLPNGKTLFIIGGCASCHATPEQKDRTLLGGGMALKSPFGTFYPPNISSDPNDGVGGWTPAQFVSAMHDGTGPGGHQLYPSFPYTSYQRMTFEDLIDLKAYLDTLPAVRSSVAAHELRFPYNIRRGIGLFQRLYVDGKTFTPDPKASDAVNRGAYLALGPAHCGECHSPRNALGGIIESQAFAGAKSPEGKGSSPNITPSKDGIGDWTEEDIVYLLETGSTPDFDVIGETMVPVQENMAKLTAEDRESLATFLKTLPPRPDAVRKSKTAKDDDASDG